MQYSLTHFFISSLFIHTLYYTCLSAIDVCPISHGLSGQDLGVDLGVPCCRKLPSATALLKRYIRQFWFKIWFDGLIARFIYNLKNIFLNAPIETLTMEDTHDTRLIFFVI